MFQCWAAALNSTSQQLLHSCPSTKDNIVHWHTIIWGANQRQREVVLLYEAAHGLWKETDTPYNNLSLLFISHLNVSTHLLSENVPGNTEVYSPGEKDTTVTTHWQAVTDLQYGIKKKCNNRECYMQFWHKLLLIFDFSSYPVYSHSTPAGCCGDAQLTAHSFSCFC